jgi:hypothetical protein
MCNGVFDERKRRRGVQKAVDDRGAIAGERSVHAVNECLEKRARLTGSGDRRPEKQEPRQQKEDNASGARPGEW